MFPTGFRFCPTDEELIRAFLYPKVMGYPLPRNHWVVDKELYGGEPPWKVFGDIDVNCSFIKEEGNKILQTVYVFTKLTKAAPKSKKWSRVTGGGTWDGQTVNKKIKHPTNGQVIGETKMLSFKRSGGKTTATDDDDGASWIMHEYSLSDVVLKAMGERENDIVLCRITKKTPMITAADKEASAAVNN